jgi:hypothetical protein
MAGFEIAWSMNDVNMRHLVIPFSTPSNYPIRVGGYCRLAESYVFGVEMDQFGAFRSSCSFLWKDNPFRGRFTLDILNRPTLQGDYHQSGYSIACEDRTEIFE